MLGRLGLGLRARVRARAYRFIIMKLSIGLPEFPVGIDLGLLNKSVAVRICPWS